MLDKDDERIYRYLLDGTFQGSFDLTTPSDHLEGITTDGYQSLVLDKEDGVFRYSLSGTFLNDSFALNASNSHAEGIATDGTSLWVVDKDVDQVFRYTTSGALVSASSVFPATHPEGIGVVGAAIWVVDKDTDRVLRFDKEWRTQRCRIVPLSSHCDRPRAPWRLEVHEALILVDAA